VVAWLHNALHLANRRILDEAAAQPARKGMATTAVVAVIWDDQLYTAWVGDSRCYVYQNRTLTRITCDHSEAQQLIDAGVLTQEEAKDLPCAHCITRCLGHTSTIEIDTQVLPPSSDALVMLTTDGLTDVMSDSHLAVILRRGCDSTLPLSGLADCLTASALKAGTQDNASVLLCRNTPAQRLPATTGLTQTGAYPVRRARMLQQLNKERCNVRPSQFLLFD
jgi:protein phosphatase